jgi:hypothetical protein
MIIADAMKKSDEMINATKIQKDNILSNARKESESIRQTAINWSKNSLEQKRMSADDKLMINKLDALVKTLKEELDYFVKENHDLRQQYEISNNKNKIN